MNGAFENPSACHFIRRLGQGVFVVRMCADADARLLPELIKGVSNGCQDFGESVFAFQRWKQLSDNDIGQFNGIAFRDMGRLFLDFENLLKLGRYGLLGDSENLLGMDFHFTNGVLPTLVVAFLLCRRQLFLGKTRGFFFCLKRAQTLFLLALPLQFGLFRRFDFLPGRRVE